MKNTAPKFTGFLTHSGIFHADEVTSFAIYCLNSGTEPEKENLVREVALAPEHFDIIRKGMRQTATMGTATSLAVPYVDIAAKTGTAQVGLAKNKVNSWVVGFFPYENPKYAFTVMMEAGPAAGTVGASSIMRGLLDWMSLNTPEYFE